MTDPATEPADDQQPAGGTDVPPESDDSPAVDAAPGESSPTVRDRTVDAEPADDDQADEPDTFDRPYVEKLRRQAAEARTRAKDRDQLAERLHEALVAATGRLADPTDLAYDETHLDDPEALTAALDALLDRKPHLAARRPTGDVGQGATDGAGSVDLAGLLRQRA